MKQETVMELFFDNTKAHNRQTPLADFLGIWYNKYILIFR